MEQPQHDLRTGSAAVGARSSARRFIAIGVVVLLHVGLIWALAVGLATSAVQRIAEDLKVSVSEERVPDKAPPPPPPEIVKPPPPTVPPPDIVITQEVAPQTNAIQAQVAQPRPQAAADPMAGVTAPASIGRPHVCAGDDYPAISRRMHEEGTVVVSFRILTNGRTSDVAVKTPSQYPRLNEAAVNCAKTWTYKAAVKDGAPVEVPWSTTVRFNLNSN